METQNPVHDSDLHPPHATMHTSFGGTAVRRGHQSVAKKLRRMQITVVDRIFAFMVV